MPQRRGEVSPKHAERLRAAVEALAAAKEERDAAIEQALKAGSSIRMVATASGMSVSQTQAIGNARGWPTAQQKAARAEHLDPEARFAAAMRAANSVAEQAERLAAPEPEQP